MPQLHLYVPKDVADEVARQAAARGLSVSRYLAELLRSEVKVGWPDGYFDAVVGGWRGRRLTRSPQGELESRESL